MHFYKIIMAAFHYKIEILKLKNKQFIIVKISYLDNMMPCMTLKLDCLTMGVSLSWKGAHFNIIGMSVIHQKTTVHKCYLQLSKHIILF